MYPKWWDKTVTIYNRTKVEVSEKTLLRWDRKVVHNCFWGQKAAVKIGGLEVVEDSKTAVRIPYNNDIVISPGDIVVLGEVFDALPDMDSGKELLKKYTGFVVKTVKKNILTQTSHIFVSN